MFPVLLQLGMVAYWVTSALYPWYHGAELFVRQLCVCGGEGRGGGRSMCVSRPATAGGGGLLGHLCSVSLVSW